MTRQSEVMMVWRQASRRHQPSSCRWTCVAYSPSATGKRMSEYLLCTDIDDRRWWPVATGVANGLWTIRLGSELEARPLSLSVGQLVSSRSLLSGDWWDRTLESTWPIYIFCNEWRWDKWCFLLKLYWTFFETLSYYIYESHLFLIYIIKC